MEEILIRMSDRLIRFQKIMGRLRKHGITQERIFCLYSRGYGDFMKYRRGRNAIEQTLLVLREPEALESLKEHDIYLDSECEELSELDWEYLSKVYFPGDIEPVSGDYKKEMGLGLYQISLKKFNYLLRWLMEEDFEEAKHRHLAKVEEIDMEYEQKNLDRYLEESECKAHRDYEENRKKYGEEMAQRWYDRSKESYRFGLKCRLEVIDIEFRFRREA